MANVNHIATIKQFNDFWNVPTLHPLVTVIDMAKHAEPIRHSLNEYGFYVIFLKEVKCGNLIYGCQYYDYQEGTLVFIAPGQIAGVEDDGTTFYPKGYALAFHPDLIHGTQLGRNIDAYTFFEYQANEALHLSEQERRTITECLSNITTELNHDIDKHSRQLIVSNIELMLNYCTRFYDRQFITREKVSHDILTRFEQILNAYFRDGKTETLGLPSVRYCANELRLSPNYFGDLVKKETGHNAQELIQQKLIHIAKNLCLDSRLSISEVAYKLGFQHPQHFSRMFKKVTGLTPGEFRSQANSLGN